ncbi:hypothetical protein [Leifsonia poae]|uniref:hypothetical protein n=1 Tax=Leifsonia poae TaxID=110933 RepID=UPI001CBEF4CE|nr:hypothetical protein [Leifsonia poae]
MAAVAAPRRRKKSTGRDRHRLELALAFGISPRRLTGWEPAEIIDYEYDDAGRVSRAIVTREPEFTDDDVTDLVGARTLERETGRYGESLPEAFSDEAAPEYYGRGAIRYLPKYRVNQAEAAVERLRKEHKDDLPDGASFYIERVTYD